LAAGTIQSSTAATSFLATQGTSADPAWKAIDQRVAITVLNPSLNDKFILIFFRTAVTIQEVSSTRQGGTSVTWNLYHGTDSSSEATKVFTSDVTTSTENTVTTSTPTSDSTLNAQNFLVVELTAVSGTVTQFHLSVRYTTT